MRVIHLAVHTGYGATGAITIETSEAVSPQPSKLAAIVSLMQSAGFLEAPRFFSCGHIYGDEDEDRERVIIQFGCFNPDGASIELAFWGDGVIDLRAFPIKYGQPWEQKTVLEGTCPIPTSDLMVMIESSLAVIADTLRLYSTSQPMDDYEPLMQAWETLNPTLVDTAEGLKEQHSQNADVPKTPAPWWQFWHNL